MQPVNDKKFIKILISPYWYRTIDSSKIKPMIWTILLN